jgi:hypothetical protein
MENFYLGSRITNDARVAREIKSRISMTKVAVQKKKTVLIKQLYLNLREKLVKGTFEEKF